MHCGLVLEKRTFIYQTEFWTSPLHQRPLFQFSVVHKKVQTYEEKVSVVCHNIVTTANHTAKDKNKCIYGILYTYTSARERAIACNEMIKEAVRLNHNKHTVWMFSAD